jgi:hypothetical protein
VVGVGASRLFTALHGFSMPSQAARAGPLALRGTRYVRPTSLRPLSRVRFGRASLATEVGRSRPMSCGCLLHPNQTMSYIDRRLDLAADDFFSRVFGGCASGSVNCTSRLRKYRFAGRPEAVLEGGLPLARVAQAARNASYKVDNFLLALPVRYFRSLLADGADGAFEGGTSVDIRHKNCSYQPTKKIHRILSVGALSFIAERRGVEIK